eukprot:TRINITY_DN2663_c0_g1_i6.p3 TRINITY_DN2663_c0_g1~~TRINITY_DN2663_c0_g1_i6.p3  ORF type:complete len:104 (+),score=13.52 TRINITY_DN2663_c0_g1_i6:134-445(+)
MANQRVVKILLLIAEIHFMISDGNREASGHRLSEYVDDSSTHCGFMSISNAPVNVGEKDAECAGDDFEMDRGWFASSKEHCKGDYKYKKLYICYLDSWGSSMA